MTTTTDTAPQPGTMIQIDGRAWLVADEPLREMFGRLWACVYDPAYVPSSPTDGGGGEWWPVDDLAALLGSQ